MTKPELEGPIFVVLGWKYWRIPILHFIISDAFAIRQL